MKNNFWHFASVEDLKKIKVSLNNKNKNKSKIKKTTENK